MDQEVTAGAGVGWVLADFGSAVFHWYADNYGSPRTPVRRRPLSQWTNFLGVCCGCFDADRSRTWLIPHHFWRWYYLPNFKENDPRIFPGKQGILAETD